jgi:hypothetical protein
MRAEKRVGLLPLSDIMVDFNKSLSGKTSLNKFSSIKFNENPLSDSWCLYEFTDMHIF